MTVNYRPDLLPYALPKRLGLDKHGLVINQQLDGEYYDDIVAWHGECRAVAGQTTTTGSDGFQNYALMSGNKPRIGGIEFQHSTGLVEWIYSDENYSWLVRVAMSGTGNTITLSVILASSFGIFGIDRISPGRVLAELSWQPTNYAGVPQELGVYDHGFLLTHNLHGNIAYLNVGRVWPAFQVSNEWPHTSIYPMHIGVGDADPQVTVHDIVRVTISGNGALDANGTGITASIVRDVPATGLVPVYSFYREGGIETPAFEEELILEAIHGKVILPDSEVRIIRRTKHETQSAVFAEYEPPLPEKYTITQSGTYDVYLGDDHIGHYAYQRDGYFYRNYTPVWTSETNEGNSFGDAILYHSANVLVLDLVDYSETEPDYYFLYAIDGSQYEQGPDAPVFPYSVSYDPIRKQWGAGQAAVWV